MFTINCGDIVTAFDNIPVFEVLSVFSSIDLGESALYLTNDSNYVEIDGFNITVNDTVYSYSKIHFKPYTKKGIPHIQIDVEDSLFGTMVSLAVN